MRTHALLVLLLVHSAALCAAPGRGAAPAPSAEPASSRIPFDAHILVDQFGYRPRDPKVAVIRDPVVGYDSARHFTPGKLYQVRRARDGSIAFTAAPIAWNDGAVEPSSGDRGWWLDFSALERPGRYFVYDDAHHARSAVFRIDQHVYADVLKAALRMFFYQRSGYAKQRPYADACWVDEPAYVGAAQDIEAHDVTDRDNPRKVRNLSGGWFDAGDTGKYVTFAAQPVHQLLTAYQQSPRAFGDDVGIPESGNGIPDVLDEVNWELEWLERMQYPDGSAALKVGDIVYASASPPSSDHNPRFYVPSCSSATIAVSGMFAHAAYVFGSIPALAGTAVRLRARAVAAWKNYQRIGAKQTHCDTGVVKAGIADWSEQEQDSEAVVAAVYLYAVTHESAYSKYVAAHYRALQPYHDSGWSRYKPEQGEALLFYATLPDADASVSRAILADKRRDAHAGDHVYGVAPGDDLYRAYLPDPQYHWGSNNPRANYGNSNVDVVTYGLDGGRPAPYLTRALDTLHYFHGVNPFGMVYLSNMYRYGATRSVNEMYHVWFAHGTRWSDARTSACGPAPGYVTGGPNADAVKDGVPATLVPPAGQPPQKSYRDWNVGWPESSWAVTEPAIYYQAAYVKLLARFAR